MAATPKAVMGQNHLLLFTLLTQFVPVSCLYLNSSISQKHGLVQYIIVCFVLGSNHGLKADLSALKKLQ